ncbi:MAG: hypothetical protein HYV35_02770 [Lentisphaerae bacterium]|nr:hypothetical protein [Lentisphaerota bacterium]
MSKTNQITFGFFLFALVLLAASVSGQVTSSLPQIQAVYGGMLRSINVIPLTASPNVSRLFASTESANSVFYADVDHSNPSLFATNVFAFRVVPDLNAAANFGTVNGIAGHPGSGKLFIADDAGLLSCSMASNTLVTNIVGQSTPPNPPGAGPISAVLIKDNVLLAIGDSGGSKTLHFGALDSSGSFTSGSGSPVTIGSISFPQMAVHPVNRQVYIIGDGSSNITKSSVAIDALSGATTFSQISLPAQVSSWNTKRIGIGPDGRLFVGGNTGDPGAQKIIAYSDDDGTNWTIVGTGMQGTSGGNVETGTDSNNYSVYFGSAFSTNKGVTNSWGSIPRDQSQPPRTHSNDGEVRVDPLNGNVVYFTTDQGIGSTTNNCFWIFEIDNGLEAVQIQDFDMTADKNVAWTAAKSGVRRATNFQTSPQWTDAIFPNNDGSPYYSVAVDQSDPNGLTAYAGNVRIYKTTDGGSNWVSVYYAGNGAAESDIVCLEVNSNDVFAGRYANMFANIGGLLYSENGGTTWTNVALGGETNLNVNDIIFAEENGTGLVYVAAAYNTNNNTGGHVYRVNESGSTQVLLSSDPISTRDLAEDSSGGLYASGWTTNYNPVVFYKPAGTSTWTQLTTNGLLPASGQGTPRGRGPVMTVGFDASSNEVPIVASGVTLYYLPSGGTEWLTSDEMKYPDGTQLNVLYWDALLVGTDTGLYGQDLGLQPVTAAVGPTIRANGQNVDSLTVSASDTVAITVSMNPDIYLGVEVDWWLVASANFTTWFYMEDADDNYAWTQFSGALSELDPVYMGALFELPTTTVLPAMNLPAGSYDFWFAVDYPMNDTLNTDAMLIDHVTVIVQ